MDRNSVTHTHLIGVASSLSARRAWIEMFAVVAASPAAVVALRKESVDRNHDDMLRYRDAEQSLSARRAWIEMRRCRVGISNQPTSLSARRAWIEIVTVSL